MSPELIYFLKVNIAITLFYAFYRLFFYKDTFFQWRRITLLLFFAISMLYPLLNIQEWVKAQEPMVVMADLYATVVLPEASISNSPDTSVNWKEALTSSLHYIYIGVLLLLFLRFFVQLFSIVKIKINSKPSILQHTKVYILPKAQSPFSFFGWIFVHPQSHTDNEMDEILTHESAHVRQWHSIDVVISEILCVICWFNPFMWLIKREVRGNLEFLADHKVLEKGHDYKTYQYHLLGLAHHKKVATLYNSFNVLPLKNRIRMMNKKRTRKIGITKYALFIPVAAILLIISNIEAIARNAGRLIDKSLSVQMDQSPGTPQEKTVEYKGKVVDANNKPMAGVTLKIENTDEPFEIKTDQNGEFSLKWKNILAMFVIYEKNGEERVKLFMSEAKDLDPLNILIVLGDDEKAQANLPANNNSILDVVEEMPEFPGGQTALMQFFSQNIKYPADAKKRGIHGRVIVQYVVEKDGTISGTRIVRSIDAELDAEAIRVVNSMPKWAPGKHKGQVMRVKYTVPVAFRLEEPSAPTETKPGGEAAFQVVEQMPEFPGGEAALKKYISENLQYPESAKQAKIQGTVVVQFVITKDGTIENPILVRSVDPALGEEALRLIRNMPTWNPGKQKGQAVNVKYTIPVAFKNE